jgi:hypothetical protein
MNPAWTLVQRKVKPNDVLKTERVPKLTQSAPPVYGKVRITDKLSINAMSVGNFDDVNQDGNLYYVTSVDHFAFVISGHLFHGNIGVIYTDAKEPQKIKDCKYTDGCTKSLCRYYHDPKLFSHSRDRRNYIASSFTYVDPASTYKNKSQCRHFGSLPNLDTDLVTICDEERDRLADQSMHDLLCSIILKESNRD